MKTIIATLLALSAPALASAQAQPAAAPARVVSASVRDLHYEVTFDRGTAAARQMRVRTGFEATGTTPVLLSLPTWTPGAYETTNFARFVSGFTATQGGQPIEWDKLDYDTWRIRPSGSGRVELEFMFEATELDNAKAWSRPDFLLFNGTNVFFYPEGGGYEFPARVTLRTEPGWRIATGMKHTGGSATALEYTAPNYHDLVDMPVFMGALEVDSTQVAGVWSRLASYPVGALSGAARQRWHEQVGRYLPELIEVFGERPFETHTTLLLFDPEYGGGSALEHQNSHVGIYNPQMIPLLVFPSITAHEMAHIWNVKRLRPADMFPYEYSRPQPTPWLWVSEGITDYYADLALLRAGVMTPQQFYEGTTGKIDATRNAGPVALEDASLDTWIQPTDGTAYIYYDKGSVAGFLLDIMIRDASDNRGSLDTVMRELYNNTWKRGRGFAAEDWWGTVQRVAGGRSFEEFNRRYIDGREPFPYDQVLPLAGLVLHADTSVVPRMGVTMNYSPEGANIVGLAPGSAFGAAGVQPGDVLLAVDSIPATGPDIGERFRAVYAGRPEGTPIPIRIRRGGQEMTLTARLAFAEVIAISVRELPNASEKAMRIRRGILEGRVD